MPESESTSNGHKKIRKTISAYKTLQKINEDQKSLKESGEVTSNFDTITKEADANFKKKVDGYTEKTKEKVSNFKANSKNQLEELIDTYKTSITKSFSGNSSSNSSVKYLSNLFIQTTNRSVGRVGEIFQQELISAVGCSQAQNFIPEQVIYIRPKSIDFFQSLTYDANDSIGKYFYESSEFLPNQKPFKSFNRELRNRITNSESYSEEYGLKYIGKTNQPLFDIQFVNKNEQTGEDGDFYKVTLSSRVSGEKVVDFLNDYLGTINVLDFTQLYKNMLDLISGAFSMKLNKSTDSLRKQTEFEKFLQRCLGLCFDNRQEIDVSGAGKLDSLDQVDDTFFELSDQELFEIETKINNIQSRVVQYKDCGTLYLPVDVDSQLSLLDGFFDLGVDTNSNLSDKYANLMLDGLSKNPDWKVPQFELETSINTEFLKMIPIAIMNTLCSPKHIFPLMVMSKAVGNEYVDEIESIDDFKRIFKKFVINIISKISAIFVEELVKIIKKDLQSLIQDTVNNISIEIRNKRLKIIFTMISLALTIANAIDDYRRCKSVIDDLQRILQLSLQLRGLSGQKIPPLLNYFARFKPGMSPSSLLAKTIENYESLGIPTGDLPDGTPNINLVAQQAFNAALMDEISENANVQTTILGSDLAILSQTGSLDIFGNLA